MMITVHRRMCIHVLHNHTELNKRCYKITNQSTPFLQQRNTHQTTLYNTRQQAELAPKLR